MVRNADAAGDKRQTLIALSDKTKSIESRHEVVSKEMTALFYKGFSEKQIDDFENHLRHILSNLVKYEEEIKNEDEQK